MKDYVVVIGESKMDMYCHCKYIPEIGSKAMAKSLGGMPGGFVSNTASIIAKTGVKTFVIDVMSDDNDGKIMLKDLKDMQIDTSYIDIDDNMEASKTLIIKDDNEHIIFVLENPSKPKIIIDDEKKELILGARYTYSAISELKVLDNYKEVISELKDKGVKLMIDAESETFSSKEDLFFFESASIMSFNDFALEKYKRIMGENAVQDLLDAGKTIIYTLGSKGCEVHTKDEVIKVDGYKIKPVDTTGAGDTFNAMFVYGLVHNWSLEETAKFANAGAARSILSVGPKSGAVSESEVRAFMSEHGR